MKKLLLVAGILLLFAVEIGKVYFIMPFPGSQKNDTIGLAYWIHKNIIWVRILLILLILAPVIGVYRKPKRIVPKVILSIVLVLYGVIFYMFNFRFLADKMFYQPRNKELATVSENQITTDKLVIGITHNGGAKAYPIQLIGYHHQVMDTIAGKPVMITYCTVCRTGRVFDPSVDGKIEKFRLVGMDHFNAMFEDLTTGSWWQQATGRAITGPLKGKELAEFPSQQMTLAAWIAQYPDSRIMQPDTAFIKKYKSLADYDRGTLESGLEKRDSASWKFKSWVVGIDDGKTSKAYDWNQLVAERMIQDSIPGTPILLTLANDTASFYVLDRKTAGVTLAFRRDSTGTQLRDIQSNSVWNYSGKCLEGTMQGTQLARVQSYQEFWHSWQTFHPRTLTYK